MTAPTSDIQHALSKTQAVEQMYQTQKQQPDADQQKFANAVQQKLSDKAHQTQESSETEESKIRKNRQDKLSLSFKKRDQQKKKQDKKKSDDNDDSFSEDVGQIVDIKV